MTYMSRPFMLMLGYFALGIGLRGGGALGRRWLGNRVLVGALAEC